MKNIKKTRLVGCVCQDLRTGEITDHGTIEAPVEVQSVYDDWDRVTHVHLVGRTDGYVLWVQGESTPMDDPSPGTMISKQEWVKKCEGDDFTDCHIRMSRDVLQRLMDELWEEGFRPGFK